MTNGAGPTPGSAVGAAENDVPAAVRPTPRFPRTARLVRLGVAGAILSFAALVLIAILAIHPFLPADESAHVDYALQVAHGHLPVAGPILHPEIPGQRPTAQYVANHPPLYYVIAGPLLRLALAAHHAQGGLLAVRALSILFGIAAIVLVAVFAGSFGERMERRRRAQLTVAAAGLTATLPSLVAATSAIQNDALMVGFVGLALALIGRAVRSGLDTRRTIALGLCCAGGMLSRATFIGVLLAILGVIALITLWPQSFRTAPTALRWRQAISRVVIVGGISALGAGWYYVLNYHRYGDFIGGSVAYGLVKDRPKQPGADSTLHYLLTFGGIKVQIQQLAGGWDSLLGGGQLHRTDVLAVIIGILICLGILAVALRSARGARWPDRGGWILLLALTVMFLISFVSVADHVAHGGGPNNRYLLSGLGFWAIGGGLLALLTGSRRWPVPVLLLLGLQAVGAVNSTLILVHRIPPLGWRDWFNGIADGMIAANIPAARPILAILLLLVLAGLIAQALALVALGRLTPAEDDTRV